MTDLTLKELQLTHARLEHTAERLRASWRTMPAGPESFALGKKIKFTQQRADDYAALIASVEPM